LGCGSGFLFDADVDPDADPGYQNDEVHADPDSTPLLETVEIGDLSAWYI
jgi:hypothetical protein